MPDGEVRARTVVDTYLDTTDGRLRAAGLAARLRASVIADDEAAAAGRDDPPAILTVKSLAGPLAGSVHDRLELEGAAGAGLDPNAWPASEARDLVAATVAHARLEAVARIRQHRRTLVVRRGGTRIELSLDDLEALRPGPGVPNGVVLARTTELEAELLAGDARQLDLLGAVLLRLDGLRPATGSKLDWAVAAARAAGEAPTGA